MKITANHTIHKQTIDIRFTDFTSADKWDPANQAKIAEVVRRSIERCFADYDYTKEYLTIDRLEFDLGVFSADQLLDKMPEKFYRELQKVLSSYRVNLDGSVPGPDKTTAGPIVKNSEVTAFLFFLQHGYLPWWYSDEPAWDREWLQKLTRENWMELRNFLRAHQEDEVYYEPALLRLIYQFSDGFLASLLNGLQLKEPVEKAWIWLTRVYETLQKAESTSFRNESTIPSFSGLRRHFWTKWISYASGRSAIPKLTTLLALIKHPSLVDHSLLGTAKKNEGIETIPEFWHVELVALKQEQGGSEPALNNEVEFVNSTKGEKIKVPDKANRIDKEDFILIPDSGLVLLHPFLPRLFEHGGWLNKNDFLSDEIRNRAINTLHYLATGDEEFPEYVLIMPKLLCGIPLEWPMELAPPLNAAEKDACNELLVQVIGHWSALRNTSPAALRETFLRRQGKLYLTDEGWRLEVQRKTEDILLGSLPWGFSMIKYSWMPKVLSVSWE